MDRNVSGDIVKTALFYHSLTGNTQIIAKFLNLKIPSSEIFDISSHETAELDSFDTLGILFPTFHLSYSTRISEFLNELPSLEGKRYFLIQTYSLMAGKAINNIWKIMNGKGADFISSHRIAMPESYPLYRKKGIMNSDFPTKEGFKDFNQFTEDLISQIDSKNTNGEKPASSIWDYIIPSPKPSKIKRESGTILFGQNCTKCGICAEVCPDKAISIDDCPDFNISKCSHCFTCYNLCPQKNISTTTIDAGFNYSGASDDLKGRFA